MKLLHFALLSLLLCLPAQAQEIEYSKGLICDTRQQAEHLAGYLDGDVGAALRAVNAEERDPLRALVEGADWAPIGTGAASAPPRGSS